MNKIGVYILTYNRPQIFKKALDSVMGQDFKMFDIIVSDNSTNDETEKIVLPILVRDKRVKYIKRGNTCPTGREHINYIIKHNEYDFFIMFHDDDVMLPNMVGTLYNYILQNEHLVAVAPNAFYLKNGKKRLFFSSKDTVILSTPKEMALKYILGGIAPFPSIMYRQALVGKLCLIKSNGGKYSDASFVISLLNNGSFAFINEPCMIYNVSADQSSQHHEFIQYLDLIKYVGQYVDKQEIRPMRIFNIYSQASTIMKNTRRPYFRKKLLSLFFKESLVNYFFKYVVRLLCCYK